MKCYVNTKVKCRLFSFFGYAAADEGIEKNVGSAAKYNYVT